MATPKRVVLASDFHLSPSSPQGIELFCRFCREVVVGADRFYVLGDLFNFWIGPGNMRVPGLEPVLRQLRELSDSGVEVTLLHGNRDFLLGRAEAQRIGGAVPGEELAVELFGKRYLLLHGDSLCTNDVGYQRSKRLLRCGLLHGLSRVLPLTVSLWIARRMRSVSRRSVAQKNQEQMGIVAMAVLERFQERFEALICGHVHEPGVREYQSNGTVHRLFVLGDWQGGGVYGVLDREGVRLLRF